MCVFEEGKSVQENSYFWIAWPFKVRELCSIDLSRATHPTSFVITQDT